MGSQPAFECTAGYRVLRSLRKARVASLTMPRSITLDPFGKPVRFLHQPYVVLNRGDSARLPANTSKDNGRRSALRIGPIKPVCCRCFDHGSSRAGPGLCTRPHSPSKCWSPRREENRNAPRTSGGDAASVAGTTCSCVHRFDRARGKAARRGPRRCPRQANHPAPWFYANIRSRPARSAGRRTGRW